MKELFQRLSDGIIRRSAEEADGGDQEHHEKMPPRSRGQMEA